MPTESERSGMEHKRNVHFLVLIHGMWGNPNHLAEASRIIKEAKGLHKEEGGDGLNDAELEVLVAQTNRDESTYDGIDWGGERVADEIEAKVAEIETDGSKVTKFSITGYSLGGLLARYVIGALHQRSFFTSIRPINFTTFATPHIGLLRYPTFFSKLTSSLGPKLLSRTGEQFYAVDDWAGSGRPLLEVMADPDQIFYQALSIFPNMTIFANAINDTTVPYATAAIEAVDPFASRHDTGLIVELDDRYPYLVKSRQLPDTPPTKPPKPRLLTPAWFRSFRPRQILPPILQFRFPFNLVMTALIPVLIPAFITLVLVRLTLSARSSRKRIRLLESDEDKLERTLGRVLRRLERLERGLEEAVVGVVEEGEGGSEGGSGTSTPVGKYNIARGREDMSSSYSDKPTSPSLSTSSPSPSPKSQPLLTPTQKHMITTLNALPQLRKELAFFEHVRNSHAMIVCRDVKRFEFHKKGESVLRRWVDLFEM